MASWARRLSVLALGLGVWALSSQATLANGQARRSAATRTEAAQVRCPAELGVGVSTGRVFCDVLIGRDPSEGILVALPPHTGPITLTFDLHNRHTYSEEQVRAGRAFARYLAVVGVLTMNNDLVSRAVVVSEFRVPRDLFDRVGGGAGPTGLKAVAPLSIESVTVELRADLDQVSLLGERLTISRPDGEYRFAAPGQPVAAVSNIRVEYRPGRRRN